MYDSDPLDPTRLHELLVEVAGSLWTSVRVVSETGSTNADLTAAARAGAGEGQVLLTGFQSGGRGRLDRTWTAPPESSIAMSMLLRPDGAGPADQTRRWTWLPLIAGLAVAESLRRAAGVAAMVKWPNDVLVGDRKICGILTEREESRPADVGSPACVIGIGINTDLSEDQLPVPWATSLALVGASTRNKTTIATTVLRAFELLYRQWQTGDPGIESAFARSYVQRCATIGREVRVVLGADPTGEHSVSGRAESIDEDGRLILRTAAGRQAFSAGDVVHLR